MLGRGSLVARIKLTWLSGSGWHYRSYLPTLEHTADRQDFPGPSLPKKATLIPNQEGASKAHGPYSDHPGGNGHSVCDHLQGGWQQPQASSNASIPQQPTGKCQGVSHKVGEGSGLKRAHDVISL